MKEKIKITLQLGEMDNTMSMNAVVSKNAWEDYNKGFISKFDLFSKSQAKRFESYFGTRYPYIYIKEY